MNEVNKKKNESNEYIFFLQKNRGGGGDRGWGIMVVLNDFIFKGRKKIYI